MHIFLNKTDKGCFENDERFLITTRKSKLLNMDAFVAWLTCQSATLVKLKHAISQICKVLSVLSNDFSMLSSGKTRNKLRIEFQENPLCSDFYANSIEIKNRSHRTLFYQGYKSLRGTNERLARTLKWSDPIFERRPKIQQNCKI